jgi:tetratricopeptide (TPR) repeat protein
MIRRVPVLIFIVLGVGIGLASAAQQAPPDLAEAYHQFLRARQFDAAGDVDAAIAAYRRALALDPAAAQVSAELAALFARENRADEAKAAAEAALAIEPDNREAHRILGLVYVARANLPRQAEETGGRLDVEAARLAVMHLEKARPAAGGSTNVDLALGRLHLQLRQFEPAIQVLRELLVRDPEVGEASLLLASALYSTRQTERRATCWSPRSRPIRRSTAASSAWPSSTRSSKTGCRPPRATRRPVH